jgi:hypothetical protein
MEHPREALELARTRKRTGNTDPRLGEAGQYVVEGMVALEQVSLRLLGRLSTGVEDLGVEGSAHVEDVLERAESRCAEVFAGVRQWLLRGGGRGDERQSSEVA